MPERTPYAAAYDLDRRFEPAESRRASWSVAGVTLVADHLAEQGWGLLSDGTVVWEDDHRVAPDSDRASAVAT